MVEPDNIVLPLIRAIHAEMADMHTQVAAKNDLTELRSELRSDIADVAADLIATRKVLSEQIFGLRRAVIDYHSTVIRHGMMIGDLTNGCAGSSGSPTRPDASPLR